MTIEHVTVWTNGFGYWLNRQSPRDNQVSVLKITLDDGSVQFTKPVPVDLSDTNPRLAEDTSMYEAFLAKEAEKAAREREYREDRARRHGTTQVNCLQRIGCTCPDCL